MPRGRIITEWGAGGGGGGGGFKYGLNITIRVDNSFDEKIYNVIKFGGSGGGGGGGVRGGVL